MSYTPPSGNAVLIEFDVLRIDSYVGSTAVSFESDSVATLVEVILSDNSDSSSLIEFDLSRRINALEISYDLNFSEVSNDYNLNFGAAAAPPSLLFAELAVGEALGGSLLLTTNLGSASLSTGETLGSTSVDARDLRLYPDILELPYPKFLGLSFWVSGVSWPLPYTTNSGVAHTLAQAFGTILTINPPTPLMLPDIVANAAFFGGEVRPIYSLSGGFKYFDTGESLDAELSIAWSLLSSSMTGGETLTVGISTLPILQPQSLGTGQELSVGLTTESTRTDLSCGENVTGELDVYDLVGTTLYGGVSLTSGLVTTSILQTTLWSGESIAGALFDHPTSYLYCSLSTGETLTFSLATSNKIDSNLSIGEALNVTIDWRPGSEISLGWSAGETLFLGILHGAPGLFPDTMGEGVFVRVDSLDEEKPWRLWDGANLEGTISQTIGFLGTSLFEGISLYADMDVRPSQPLTAILYCGEAFEADRPYVQHRAYLSATISAAATLFACLDDMTVDFDLRGPIRLDTTDWFWNADRFMAELDEPPPSRGWGSGCGEVVFAELQCRPRFSSHMYVGETFTSERGYEFVDSSIGVGAHVINNDPLYLEPLVALCYPNLFPYADSIEVELEWEEIRCSNDFVYVGESMLGNIGVWRQFSANYYAGEHFGVGLTLDPAIRCTLWHGEHIFVELATTYGIGVTFGDGASVVTDFERESGYFYVGESVRGEIDMTFYVEFAEVGCLDNEFIPINENGDPDISKRLPVCVEGHEFLHDIKARCV